ncbi:MAG: hypothetical protein LBG10_05335 [Treponema sp.]|jgi:hypothetical protein|nr:hypothetical protein [Treponema sp.]
MSVRATDRLIADVVTVSALPNSPQMVVLSVDAENKTVDTVWFSGNHEAQHGVFPASALDRVEAKAAPVQKEARVPKKPGKR